MKNIDQLEAENNGCSGLLNRVSHISCYKDDAVRDIAGIFEVDTATAFLLDAAATMREQWDAESGRVTRPIL